MGNAPAAIDAFVTQAQGYPRRSADLGNHAIQDCFYGAWSSVFNVDPDSLIGVECPYTPRLALQDYHIEPNEAQTLGTIFINYASAEVVRPMITNSVTGAYTIRVGTLEKPLETHPDYKTCWNYMLAAKTGTSSAFTGWDEKTDLSTDNSGNYAWVKTRFESADYPVILEEKLLPGQESYIVPAPIVELVKYYSDGTKNEIVENGVLSWIGKLRAPLQTFGLSDSYSNWLVSSAELTPDGMRWRFHIQYVYADNWSTLTYAETTP